MHFINFKLIAFFFISILDLFKSLYDFKIKGKTSYTKLDQCIKYFSHYSFYLSILKGKKSKEMDQCIRYFPSLQCVRIRPYMSISPSSMSPFCGRAVIVIRQVMTHLSSITERLTCIGPHRHRYWWLYSIDARQCLEIPQNMVEKMKRWLPCRDTCLSSTIG